MAVTRDDVISVAGLARLRLTAEEVNRFTGQLNDILRHVEVLQELDVTGVEEGSAAVGRAPLRSEDAGPDPLRIPVSELAPAWEDGFFTVPRLAALDSTALDEPFEDKARVEAEGAEEEER